MSFVWRLGFVLGCALSMVLGTGCRTADYYGQAIGGQLQVLAKRQPIEKLIANPPTDPALKRKLELVLQFREFADRELKLPVDGHYRTYADLGRRYVVWNVTAAPEFSLKAKAWWYPIVGRVTYRGYFNEANAKRYGEYLARKGYDVDVDGIEAYSTLGWFRDPLLNTFIHHDEADLAAILFHELAHQRLYINGDTDFNEAFASAVEREGVRRWLRARGNLEAITEFEASMRREEQFSELILKARKELETIYGDSSNEQPAMSPEEITRLRAAKSDAIKRLQDNYAKLKASWGGDTGYDGWFARPLNNAHLKTVDTYHRLVPAFEQLLREKDGDLSTFYQEVEALGKLRDKQRQERLEALRTKAVAK